MVFSGFIDGGEGGGRQGEEATKWMGELEGFTMEVRWEGRMVGINMKGIEGSEGRR